MKHRTNDQSSTLPRKLTIAIPTYNRVNELEVLLESIACQCELFQERLNVYISDNASEKDNSEIVEQFAHRINNLKFFRRNFNAGPDENIASCFWQAAQYGNFVWIIGDDDFLMDGALREIFRIIDLRAEVIYVGFFGFEKSFSAPKKRRSKRLGVTRRVLNISTFIDFVNINVTLISVWILDTSSLNLDEVEQSIQKFKKTNLVQLSWVIPAISLPACYLAIVPTYVVAVKANNSGGYGIIQVFVLNLDKVITELDTSLVIRKKIFNFCVFYFLPAYMIRERREPSAFIRTDSHIIEKLETAYPASWRVRYILLPAIRSNITFASRLLSAARQLERIRKIIVDLRLLLHAKKI